MLVDAIPETMTPDWYLGESGRLGSDKVSVGVTYRCIILYIVYGN